MNAHIHTHIIRENILKTKKPWKLTLNPTFKFFFLNFKHCSGKKKINQLISRINRKNEFFNELIEISRLIGLVRVLLIFCLFGLLSTHVLLQVS